MPNKKSAIKRVRTSERNRLYNRYWKSRCKTAMKKVLATVQNGDAEAAVLQLNAAQSVFDKAVVKGVLHRNTAARRKALMTAKVKSLSAEKPAE
ncbi:30S ribosomal protein S20 [Pyramidobacter sp. SM-530-WT-4B]|uniref:Small ribosomal subunit protein bS20 n=1 Tax=Pyramidobacter porci TaxID=2605789 RepID=A0A6L5YA69_9BACT|nr:MULTISPECIES: 30S ribosomal protein S20 [Pyramidobacter]MCI6260687.1 30S ribosomal protein S20 [Pyramidobacter sp.]MCI7403460.1 30S ribosomal protein S20 [Pyramidobacter sp.]MDY2648863.1 30S ribosomal protein S20 [Pyramidobacter porci]MDY3212221.1 30S ribosomal protein S20 [Pyramidobacter sp.]MST55180.1 30S ribosomal protein S20 [Pyramidobacter porci]